MATISLLEFLKNTNMIGTSIIAGWGGLSRKINSIAVIETPLAIKWLKGNELVLTTGSFLNTTKESFVQLISKLVQHGASAIALAPQSYVGTIPNEVIDIANQLLFPIISMPSSMTFWELSKFFFKISEASELENSSLNSQSLVEENYGSMDLLDYLAGKLAGVILLQKEDLEPVMVFCNDQKILGSVLLEREKRHIREQLLNYSLFEHKYDSMVEDTIVCWYELIYPIIDNEKISAYLSFIVQEDKVNLIKDKYFDNMVEYIILSYKDVEKVIRTMKKKKRYVFYEAITKEVPTNFVEYTRIESVLNTPGLIVATQILGVSEKSDLFDKVIDLIESRCQARDAEALVCNVNENIIILLHSIRFSLSDIRQFISKIQSSLVELGIDRVKWGIGTEAKNLAEYKTSYSHALQALFTANFETENSNVKFYIDLGIYQLIKDGNNFSFFYDYSTKFLQPILTLEFNQRKELLTCVAAFFEENCSYSNVSKKLFIHENTVRYRLQKVEEYLEIDLKKSDDKFLLFFAIKILDLAEKLSLSNVKSNKN